MIERAQRLGLVGRRADIAREIDRCGPFVDVLAEIAAEETTVVDLGSGNGLPGLVVATTLPVRVILVEVGASRAAFLRWAIGSLGLGGFVEVAEGKAEVLAREPSLRCCAQAVVARSFGPPATTAECAVGFLAPGGSLIVAEPPGEGERWPAAGVGELGLRDLGPREGGVRHLILAGAVDDAWPRPAPRPRRSPLFGR
ncbi:MAG: class I SAM-dependent methyltransferase [Acidimicrobiales bacterium]